MTDVTVSVVLPTYYKNSYDETLQKILMQTVRPKEILIIRNGAEEERFEAYEGYTVCHTRQLGLNNARNKGIELAIGDVVAFIDDDTLPQDDWIETIARLHGEIHEVPVIGGKIYPIWPENRKPPEWLRGLFLEYLTLLDYSPDLTVVTSADWIAGMNLSIKAWVFKQLELRFDPDLDRKGDNLLSNGETELFERIRLLGYEIMYSPTMVVGHRITPERMTPHFFLQRAYWQGISDYLVDKKLHRAEINSKAERMRNEFIRPNVALLDAGNLDDHETLLAICNIQFAIGYLGARFTHESTS